MGQLHRQFFVTNPVQLSLMLEIDYQRPIALVPLAYHHENNQVICRRVLYQFGNLPRSTSYSDTISFAAFCFLIIPRAPFTLISVTSTFLLPFPLYSYDLLDLGYNYNFLLISKLLRIIIIDVEYSIFSKKSKMAKWQKSASYSSNSK